MALTYSLDIATPTPAAEVAGALHETGVLTGLFDDSVTPQRILDEGVATRFGTWLRVVAAAPRPYHPVVTDLGFVPTVQLAFRLSKEDPIAQQQDDVVRLTLGVLGRVPGDAVLHRELETIWLLRRGGDLTISERDDIWPDRRLAILDQPVRRRTHTFAE
jgi:hypothetical protein